MRDIKFRGKRVDGGGWVYGHLNGWVTDGKQVSAIITPEEVFIVDPSTVGQYSGLKDKNGKDVFEGDVIAQRAQKNTWVEYDKCKWVLRNDEKNVEWRQELHNKHHLHLEIIGSVFDNPELLTT